MGGNLTGFRKDAPSDARQVRSRNALIGALLELLEEGPFDQLTIREISARANIGYATFFRHYPDKEALLGDVANEAIQNLFAKAAPILLDVDSANTALALCEYVAGQRTLWHALLTGGAASIVREEFIRQTRDLASLVPIRFEWLPVDLGITIGVGNMIDILAWWLENDSDRTVEQIAETLDRIVVGPLTERHRGPIRSADAS